MNIFFLPGDCYIICIRGVLGRDQRSSQAFPFRHLSSNSSRVMASVDRQSEYLGLESIWKVFSTNAILRFSLEDTQIK